MVMLLLLHLPFAICIMYTNEFSQVVAGRIRNKGASSRLGSAAIAYLSTYFF